MLKFVTAIYDLNKTDFLSRTFNIINPTDEGFTYKWESLEATSRNLSLFNCHTQKGSVDGKKLTEATFSFIPNELGTFEKFYNFVIEKYELITTFLMVGTAREPCVFFSTPHVVLKNTIMGIEVTDFLYIKNNEQFPLNYHFKKYSTYSEGRQQKLIVQPLIGTLPANGELPIR